MVFGQPARHDHDFWVELHKQSVDNSVLHEEDLPETIGEDFNFMEDSTNSEDLTYNGNISPKPLLTSNRYDTDYAEKSIDTPHKRIRDEAEKNYIHTAERQLKNYQRSLKKQKMFQINDIVGLKIADVDRSNTAPSILPCKIIEIVTKEESLNTLYKVATVDGIINDFFSSSNFMDLSQTVSADLRQTDASTLPTISFIQACQIFTQYKSIDACKCIGSCDTNRCPCKKRSIQCCSKCHRGKFTLCKNNI